jgi:hypothetical protein
MRRRALLALGESRADAKTVVPAIAAAVKDKNVLVRTEAIQALGKRGHDAREASPVLIAILRTKLPPKPSRDEVQLHHAAGKALWKIDPNAVGRLYPRPSETIWKVEDVFENKANNLAVEVNFSSPDDLRAMGSRDLGETAGFGNGGPRDGSIVRGRMAETTYALESKAARFRLVDGAGHLVTFCIGYLFTEKKDNTHRLLIFFWPERPDATTKEVRRLTLGEIRQLTLVDAEGAFAPLANKAASRPGTLDDRRSDSKPDDAPPPGNKADEDAATAMLNGAKLFADKPDKLREIYEAVIAKYPDTKAAEAAKKQLDALGPKKP